MNIGLLIEKVKERNLWATHFATSMGTTFLSIFCHLIIPNPNKLLLDYSLVKISLMATLFLTH